MEHLSDAAIACRKDLMRCGLETGKAFGLKEAFSYFWKSRDKHYAEEHFKLLYDEVVKSGLKPMIKVAKRLNWHLGLIVAATRPNTALAL